MLKKRPAQVATLQSSPRGSGGDEQKLLRCRQKSQVLTKYVQRCCAISTERPLQVFLPILGGRTVVTRFAFERK